MEKDESRWVEDRLRALDPPADWTPDSARALARLRSRRRLAAVFCGAAAAAVAGVILLALSSPQACATPMGCTQHFWERVFPRHAAPAPAGQPADFHQSGSPDAPIVCELYSDFACPGCAAFHRDVLPRLMADYVKPGKMLLIQRNFPLARHRYSRLAARYANAAGRLGYYDAATDRLFATQVAWSETGEIAAALAPVLPPKVLARLQSEVERDPTLDDSVSNAAGEVRGTPTLIVIYRGRREAFFPAPNYELLRGYFDALLAP
jgi:hypothetical protein